MLDGKWSPWDLHPFLDGNPPAWAVGWGDDKYGVFTEVDIDGVEQRLRWIPPGAFMMGSPGGEPGRSDQEGPQHLVQIPEGYWLFSTPVTQALYEAVMGDNPSRFKSPDRPVEQVSFGDAAAFLAKINERIPGLDLRLPSEAEWEYSARGGYEHKLYPWEGPYLRNSKGCFLANFKPGRGDYIADNFEYTAPVDAYFPNDYGLYNMPGNVAEWCEDDFEETGYSYAHDLNPRYIDIRIPEEDRAPGGAEIRKVTRGGSWKDIGYFLSCGTRSYEYADTAKSFIGFRSVVAVIGRSGAAGGF